MSVKKSPIVKPPIVSNKPPIVSNKPPIVSNRPGGRPVPKKPIIGLRKPR